uniref:thrombomodulin n=1 Tax=Euleptes europaea TaxID=460621 RepID=UPI00253FD3C9|nr:thrombomodulin [Euleptes europaea]
MRPLGLLLLLAALAGAGLPPPPAPSSPPPPPSPPSGPAPPSAQCLGSRCFALFWEARSFAGAGAGCAAGGGRLLRAASTVEAEAAAVLRGGRAGGVWLGLRLPEGRCAQARRGPLRGFQWAAGDERSDYEAWAGGGPAEGACGPRCALVGAALRWEERACEAPADGFLCEYTYPDGTCAPLAAAAAARYATPFGARDGDLSALPPGTTARLPGLPLRLVCRARPDGAPPAWAAAAPGAWPCRLAGGGCEGRCREDAQGRPSCTCPEGAALGADGRSCLSPCARLRCQHQCAPHGPRAVCLCHEGYRLGADGRSCRDVDDCLAQPGPCEQRCVNTAGGFLCRCFAGYTLVDGRCTKNEHLCFYSSCQQDCLVENGTLRCACFEGFAPDPGDPRRCLRFCNRSRCPAQCDPHTGDSCYCPDGYIIEEHEDGAKVCTDIDECDEGYCDGDCRNLFGGYECVSGGPGPASQRPDFEGSGDATLFSTQRPLPTSVPPRGGRSPGTLVAIVVSTVLSFVALAAVVYCFLKKLDPPQTKVDYKCQQLETEVVMEPVGPQSTSYKQKM